MKHSIHDEKALRDTLAELGEKPYRVGQIHQEFYKNSHSDFSQFTTLPLPLREKLAERVFFREVRPTVVETSDDGQTTKMLCATADDKKIECVIMRHLSGRTTLCVSCQAGCPMACAFCATGKLGLDRNLAPYEILDQVDMAKEILRKEGRELRNIVFMGMGEPLLNYANLVETIHTLCDQKKWDFSGRRITVSTCGIVPRIVAFGKEFPQVSLAVSLHAPNDEARSKIMPVNKNYPVSELMASLDEYSKIANKRVFYEYIMIAGVTDRLEYAPELARLLSGRLAHVNFIPYNPGEGIMGQGHLPSSRIIIERFQKALEKEGIPSTVRHTMGDDIAAACGQLARKHATDGRDAEEED